MNITDPIADMLTRVRNAAAAKKDFVLIPFSKVKLALAKILENEKYFFGVNTKEVNGAKFLEIKLKYNARKSAINSIKRISKSGRRVYVAKEELPVVLNGYGLAIISTSRGMMTNKEAKKQGLGGEVICEVY